MKKLKFILSALMLTVCMSAFIGAGGATAFAYEGEQEPVAECAHEYTEEVVEGTCTIRIHLQNSQEFQTTQRHLYIPALWQRFQIYLCSVSFQFPCKVSFCFTPHYS